MRGLRTSYIFCLQAKTKMKSISWKTKTLELTEWRKRSTFLFFLVFNFLMVKMKLKTFFTRFILNFSHFLAMWQKFTYKLQTESKQTKTQKWTPSPGRTGPLKPLSLTFIDSKEQKSFLKQIAMWFWSTAILALTKTLTTVYARARSVSAVAESWRGSQFRLRYSKLCVRPRFVCYKRGSLKQYFDMSSQRHAQQFRLDFSGGDIFRVETLEFG